MAKFDTSKEISVSARTGPLTFMVVDDQQSIRKLVRGILEQSSLASEVIECGSAAEALADLAMLPVDFVISDWNMPGLSGLDLLRRIRTDPEYRHVRELPVMLLTSQCSRQNVLDAAAAGVSDYVVKPFNAAQLIEKIQRVVARMPASPDI